MSTPGEHLMDPSIESLTVRRGDADSDVGRSSRTPRDATGVVDRARQGPAWTLVPTRGRRRECVPLSAAARGWRGRRIPQVLPASPARWRTRKGHMEGRWARLAAALRGARPCHVALVARHAGPSGRRVGSTSRPRSAGARHLAPVGHARAWRREQGQQQCDGVARGNSSHGAQHAPAGGHPAGGMRTPCGLRAAPGPMAARVVRRVSRRCAGSHRAAREAREERRRARAPSTPAARNAWTCRAAHGHADVRRPLRVSAT